MCGAANWKEFSKTLNDGEDNHLINGHEGAIAYGNKLSCPVPGYESAKADSLRGVCSVELPATEWC